MITIPWWGALIEGGGLLLVAAVVSWGLTKVIEEWRRRHRSR